MIKVIGFDFDGTLILSEGIKAKIFEHIFLKEFGTKKGVR
jgi:beta-phosphoglucomutase-like phosphatase (HAD superfamily)